MATKSKNIKYSKATKIIAVIIAAIMFFLSGCFANLFIRGFADYNAYDKDRNHYTHTHAFRRLMNTVENFYISDYEQDDFSFDTFEEFMKSDFSQTALAEYGAYVLEVSAAYDLLEKSGIEVYVNHTNEYRYLYPYKNFVYIMDSSGSYSHEDSFLYSDGYIRVYPGDESAEPESTTLIAHTEPTSAVEIETRPPSHGISASVPDGNNPVGSAFWVGEDGYGKYKRDGYDEELRFYLPGSGEPPLEVQDIADALEKIRCITGSTCYGESTKERLLEEVQSNKEQFLRDYYKSNTTLLSYDYVLKRVKNINYAIIANGNVRTNCAVELNDTEEQIVEKLGGEFVEASVNGEYKLLKGSECNSNPNDAYSELFRMLFGESESILRHTDDYFIGSRNLRAYFSFGIGQQTDAFSVSYNAYSDFKGSLINDVTTCLVLFAVCFTIACAACLYLLLAAGKTAHGIRISFFDKIPLEINLAVVLSVCAFSAVGAAVLVYYEALPDELLHTAVFNYGFTSILMEHISWFTCEFTGLFVALFFTVITALPASVIRNIRNKSFLKHTLCYLVFRLIYRIIRRTGKVYCFISKPFRKLFGFIAAFFRRQIKKVQFILACDYSKGQSRKFKIIACVSVGVFVVATVIYYLLAGMLAYSYESMTLLMIIPGIIGDIAIIVYFLLVVVSADRIFAAVHDIKNGSFNRTIDTKYMPPFMKRFAQDILSMQDGLQAAVESAVRDQRMKAELITNVSHDLKTPLTSIVNYADLLKKCEVEDETAQKYITVLDEKAQKMKTLIEDLVEASKASSGAMEIHPVKINLVEFAAQAVGEHEDELRECGIEIVLNCTENAVYVTADSQKTSRIVENLFSNIRKYALGGTRVYIEIKSDEKFGSLVFKNISKERLNISADELTRRFVKGDASRSGEGSGLGLSIAKSLCQLQNGELEIRTDGDLFKATVSLPRA